MVCTSIQFDAIRQNENVYCKARMEITGFNIKMRYCLITDGVIEGSVILGTVSSCCSES